MYDVSKQHSSSIELIFYFFLSFSRSAFPSLVRFVVLLKSSYDKSSVLYSPDAAQHYADCILCTMRKLFSAFSIQFSTCLTPVIILCITIPHIAVSCFWYNLNFSEKSLFVAISSFHDLFVHSFASSTFPLITILRVCKLKNVYKWLRY